MSSNDLNNVTMIGRLVSDPEIRYTPNGTAVLKFRMANNYSFKRGEENQDQTSFFQVTCFQKLAEICNEYLKKGNQIGLNGCIQIRSWDANGKKEYMTEIIADNIQFLTAKKDNKNDEVVESNSEDIPLPGGDEDVPF